MKKLKLQGKIQLNYNDSYKTIFLIQEDGYKIDLFYRLKELSHNSSSNQINYHISDKLLNDNQLQELSILSLTGGINMEQERIEYRYSSYTTDVDYITTMKIGNHDLLKELGSDDGKYIYFDINYKQW